MGSAELPKPSSADTGEVECPWRQTLQTDLWEYHRQGDHELECDSCDRPLTLTVETVTTYTLRPMAQPAPEEPHA